MNLLAQLIPYDGTADAPPKPPEARPMSFSDFQSGMQQWNDGATDNTVRNGLLVMVALVVLVALILHVRARLRRRPELASAAHLGRELCRIVPFPFGTRILLWWVAKSTHVHIATLLVSQPVFDHSVAAWQARGTFSPLRSWGAGRLDKLKRILYDCPPDGTTQ